MDNSAHFGLFYLRETCRICNFYSNCYDYYRIARHRKFTEYRV